jgi:hypothetical protein
MNRVLGYAKPRRLFKSYSTPRAANLAYIFTTPVSQEQERPLQSKESPAVCSLFN